MFPTLMANAHKTATSIMEANMENVRNTQETMKRQREIASRMEFPWQVQWSKGPMGMPSLTYKASSADSTREMFHLMADANMKNWEQAAKAWANAPSWLKVSYSAPGEFLANWFDQWRDGKFDGTTPANMEAMLGALTAGVKKAEQDGKELVAKSQKVAETVVEETAETVDETLPDLFKPELFDAAQGDADDLTQIKGIGPKLSETLNELGVWHLSQIAAWTPENIGWLDEQLSFKGRIQREAWVEQAQEFLKKTA